jgi:hypothetical protein
MAASAVDALAAVEHRCLQLVMMAEAKARDDRASLEGRIRELEEGDVGRLEAIAGEVKQCERTLAETASLLGSVSAEFGAAHEASYRHLRHLMETRAASETSAFQRVKLAIAEFHDYRKEMKKNALWRIAQAYQQGLHHQASLELIDDTAMGGDSYAHMPGVPPTAPAAQRAILEDLKKRFIAAARSHEDEDSPFLLDAVYAYLIGAIDTLLKFGDTIAAQLHRAHTLDIAQRRHLLLDEERDVFRRRVRQDNPANALAEISNEAMQRVLLERLVDQREQRNADCVRLVATAMDDVSATVKSRLERSSETFVQYMHTITNATLHVPASRAMGAGGNNMNGNNNTMSSSAPNSSALIVYQSYVRDAEGRIFARLVERHLDEYAALRGDFEAALDGIHRSLGKRDVKVNQEITVFSLDQLKVEQDHRALTGRVMQERFMSMEVRMKQQVTALTDKINQLQSTLEETRAERAVAQRVADERASEIARLQSVLNIRHESSLVVHTDVRQVTYEVNYASFGETWQESLLNMRNRIHKELRDENMRFVAKITNIIRTHIGDESQTEQLYETRLQTVVREMEEDNRRKLGEAKRRFTAERQLLHDECEARLKALREDCAVESVAYKRKLDADYELKVKTLNDLFEERVRAWESRTANAEAFFESKYQELKQHFLARENNLELQTATRDIDVARQYEAEAAALKLALNQREHRLEAERMKIMTSVQSRIHEKVMTVRRSFDFLLKQLQETVFAFFEQQRVAFDEQRAKEHIIFSHFMFGSIRTHQDHHKLQVEAANRRVEIEAEGGLRRQADAVTALQRQHEQLVAHCESTHSVRVAEIKRGVDSTLRRTQDLRCEQDGQFWASCASSAQGGESDPRRQQSPGREHHARPVPYHHPAGEPVPPERRDGRPPDVRARVPGAAEAASDMGKPLPPHHAAYGRTAMARGVRPRLHREGVLLRAVIAADHAVGGATDKDLLPRVGRGAPRGHRPRHLRGRRRGTPSLREDARTAPRLLRQHVARLPHGGERVAAGAAAGGPDH